MSYAAEHAGALADVADAGAAVTFTGQRQTYNPATGTSTPDAPTTVAGHAIQVRGDPLHYQALGLVQSEAPTLLFTPTAYGEYPEPGYTVTWGGQKWTVKDVAPLAPDGTVILARVIVVR